MKLLGEHSPAIASILVAAAEKAKALRQSLARQEGYRDAYLTSD